MSRIYFHFEDGTAAEVRGSERAHMDILSRNVALSFLSFWHGERHWLQDCMPEGFYGKSGDMDIEKARMYLGLHGCEFLQANGMEKYDTWQTVLNTAMVLGSDHVKLCARIHGCCEIWGRIEGANRKWFAEMCRMARASLVFRNDQGWEGTIKAIAASDKSPVVMSYSVTEQFPASGLFEFDTEKDREKWDAMPFKKRWKEGVETLRKGWPEIKEEGFSAFRFGVGMDLLQLQDMWFEQRKPAPDAEKGGER